jgi:transposase-like protein
MTHQIENKNQSNSVNPVVQHLIDNGMDSLAETFGILLNQAMLIERSKALRAQPYERTEERQGHANGFKDKTIKTRLGAILLDIPQVRGPISFYPDSVLEKGQRSEQALTLSMAEMYVQGVSTRKVTAVLETLCGLEVSSSQVSKAAAKLDEQMETWRNRLLGVCPYLILDARYEKIRQGGQVIDCAVLIAIAVDQEGKRTVLGVSVALSEAEINWRSFINSLIMRGLKGVLFIVSDDHPGLRAARIACLPTVPWQRCQFHLQKNAQAFVPKVEMRSQIAQAIRSIFNATDLPDAQQRLKDTIKKFELTAPKLVDWMETNIPEGFTVFKLPSSHQRRMRTSNALERLNQELKRRTRVIRIFPNDKSLLRLITALLIDQSEQWETDKIYLNMKPDFKTS